MEYGIVLADPAAGCRAELRLIWNCGRCAAPGRGSRAWTRRGAACPWELRFTVGSDEVAAAAGQLLRQTWAGPGRRTFHYSLPQPTPPCHLALAVGEGIRPSRRGHASLDSLESTLRGDKGALHADFMLSARFLDCVIAGVLLGSVHCRSMWEHENSAGRDGTPVQGPSRCCRRARGQMLPRALRLMMTKRRRRVRAARPRRAVAGGTVITHLAPPRPAALPGAHHQGLPAGVRPVRDLPGRQVPLPVPAPGGAWLAPRATEWHASFLRLNILTLQASGCRRTCDA